DRLKLAEADPRAVQLPADDPASGPAVGELRPRAREGPVSDLGLEHDRAGRPRHARKRRLRLAGRLRVRALPLPRARPALRADAGDAHAAGPGHPDPAVLPLPPAWLDQHTQAALG